MFFPELYPGRFTYGCSEKHGTPQVWIPLMKRINSCPGSLGVATNVQWKPPTKTACFSRGVISQDTPGKHPKNMQFHLYFQCRWMIMKVDGSPFRDENSFQSSSPGQSTITGAAVAEFPHQWYFLSSFLCDKVQYPIILYYYIYMHIYFYMKPPKKRNIGICSASLHHVFCSEIVWWWSRLDSRLGWCIPVVYLLCKWC